MVFHLKEIVLGNYSAFMMQLALKTNIHVSVHYIFSDKLLHFKRYSSGMRGGGACIRSSFIPYH